VPADAPGDNAPPAVPWKKIFFEREIRGVFVGSVKEADGPRGKRFRYEIRPEDQHLTITFVNPQAGPTFDGSYAFPDAQTLRLSGHLGGQPVEVLLTRRR